MRGLALAGLVVAGCGRLGFDGDAARADDVIALDAGDPTLALWFSFDGGFDELISGRVATCTPASTCPTIVPGKHGMAVQFDGIDDCLQLPDDGATDTPVFTLAAWLNQPEYGEYSPFAKPFAVQTTIFNSWQIEEHTAATLGFTTHDAGRHDVMLISEPSVGVWHHIAMTFDGSQKQIYIDGALAMTQGEPDAVQFDSGPVLVGCDINGGVLAYPYKGVVDGARFYRRVLGVAEIAALAQ
ncbi:MAG: hypothetical protein JWO36_2590 [Myxococcales bacterium]|nr:hypothetical protein [Myxococcales bacterium]